jgi:hypothetical protein
MLKMFISSMSNFIIINLLILLQYKWISMNKYNYKNNKSSFSLQKYYIKELYINLHRWKLKYFLYLYLRYLF